MNILKRFYCRAFQTGLRIALPFLPYRNPEIMHQIDAIPSLLIEKNLQHPLIVTDGMLRSLGMSAGLEKTLAEADIPYAIYDKIRQNPTSLMVEEAFLLYQEDRCDCLIAFGGGSSMDCAKAVGARIARPEKELYEMSGILKVLRKTPLMIAIPTTAGTGSEATLAAVIVDSESRHKYVINDFPLIPDYAVLDPSTIHLLPRDIAAATGMDALTHAVEAYIGRSTTLRTRKDAVRAVRYIFSDIEDSSSHKRRRAEKNMLLAAHLAGRAFTRSYVGYVHAVSHSLSGQYDMPHGLTNAILLPIVLEMYGPAVYKKLAKLALAVGMGTKEEPAETLAKRFIRSIYDLNARLGIPSSIEGIREEDIPQLAAYADKEANPLYPVPVLWDRKALEAVYRKAADREKLCQPPKDMAISKEPK